MDLQPDEPIYGLTLSEWEEVLGCVPTPYLVECACYKALVATPQHYRGCHPRSYHLKRMFFEYQKMTLGDSWNPLHGWYKGADRMCRMFCGENPDEGSTAITPEYDVCMVPACSNAMKTYLLTRFMMLHFIAFPAETICYIATVSVSKLKRGIWSEAVSFLEQCPEIRKEYKILDSNQDRIIMWENPKGHPQRNPKEKCALYALAITKGDTTAVGKIAGVRNEHVMMFIDEAQSSETELFKVADTNLRSGTKFFRLIAAGNPSYEGPEFTRRCEPVGGFQQEPPAPFYISKTGAMVVQLDATRDNPNVSIKDGTMDPKQPVINPWLQKMSDIIAIVKSEGMNSLKWYQMVRGWWTPDSADRCMIPRAAINMGYMRDAFKFDCAVHTGAAVDLGYDGGDRCVWQPFQIGEVITKVRSGDGWEDGKVQAIQLGPPRFVKVDISSSTPQAFQISEQIRAWNKEIGVETAWFGFDSTAAVGMTGIFQQDIGFDVIPVNHSGAVSSNKFRAGDELTPEFLVDRKVSEMWEATGIWLSEGQLRGLSETAVRELGIRKFDIMSGGKKRIQSKRQMRKEVGFSPDEGDAVCIVVEIVRHHGGQAGGLISGNQVASQNGGIPTAWQRMMQKFNNPNFGVGAQ